VLPLFVFVVNMASAVQLNLFGVYSRKFGIDTNFVFRYRDNPPPNVFCPLSVLTITFSSTCCLPLTANRETNTITAEFKILSTSLHSCCYITYYVPESYRGKTSPCPSYVAVAYWGKLPGGYQTHSGGVGVSSLVFSC